MQFVKSQTVIGYLVQQEEQADTEEMMIGGNTKEVPSNYFQVKYCFEVWQSGSWLKWPPILELAKIMHTG